MKNVTILVFGMLITQLSFAQGEFRFGLKGSSNFGWVGGTSKNIVNDGTTVAFGYGIMGDYYFKPNYGISAEIMLSNIKSKFTITEPLVFNSVPGDTVNDLRYEYNIQYLDIPLTMKFRTKEIGDMTYFGQFGVSMGFALNAKTSIVSTGLPKFISDQEPTEYRVNDAEGDAFTVNNFDDKVFLFRLPLIIGGGIEYKMAGSTSLQGGVRIANTFTDMFVKDKTAIAKNNYVALSIGVLF
ncbi:PorT family protein [Bacteroidia bacterium]|nr:PorT family protein [Bacteroidia bacterium]MDC0105587.1 PorT family protein [Bacteroidia bacterium]